MATMTDAQAKELIDAVSSLPFEEQLWFIRNRIIAVSRKTIELPSVLAWVKTHEKQLNEHARRWIERRA